MTERSQRSAIPALSKVETRALEDAEDLYDEAIESEDPDLRQAQIFAALATSPLLADAYVTLAIEEAQGSAEALFYWRTALLAAEFGLGEATLADLKGEFWGFTQTRPYMRAKHGLALTLWSIGLRAEAMSHLWEMLDLNPNDNQGVRYVLLNFLLQTKDDISAAGLIARFDEDDSADMTWGHALLAFRLKGEDAAQRELGEALKSNKHVPAYLLGRKKLPKRMPDYYEMGSVAEAQLYAQNCGEAWRATRGAMHWLERAVKA